MSDLKNRLWGYKLRQARKNAGISAPDLARKVYIPSSSLWSIENGHRRPPKNIGQELRKFVGETPSEQEHVYWDLFYLYRSPMKDLALKIVNTFWEKPECKKFWSEKPGIDSAIKAAWWLWDEANDGEIVDWLIYITHGIRIDFPSIKQLHEYNDLLLAEENEGDKIVGVLSGLSRTENEVSVFLTPEQLLNQP
ncbi:helix-turn-helix domain protein [Sulfobacillus thermosulfidooxidans DSM 9293]|uniref:Helix-turn-helix domain protein n=2 Tax=Sulfobacillus thermosulfidooxidans TaxID=28034 RepID=A0A1W1WL59_SULTA|nr:helix-turn-helix domain protein [Sulfobacillus thermosulfidooxidans DSM 9293]